VKIPASAIMFLLAFATSATAHFAMIIPSKDVISNQDPKKLELLVQFTHPFEGGPLMQMDKPEKFGVVANGKVTDLKSQLTEKKDGGVSLWETSFELARPADYIFYVVPQPYWEAAEDKFIVQITKVIVDAFGAQEGWDTAISKETGIPVEILPLTRPYGLYAGNIFTGQVLKNGKPVQNVDIEIEYWGAGKSAAPTSAHVKQVIKSDGNGVFSYAMPKAGWWGFAAIMESDQGMKHEGKDKKVELDAVIWVRTYPME
jgi:cobalt/nickel transport protein